MNGARKSVGFTLIEMLVAIAILALIASVAWRGLDQIVRTRDALQTSQNRLDDLQRLFATLARDAAAARSIQLDAAGQMVFLMAPEGAMPADRDVTVGYRLDGDRLMRRYGLDARDENLLDKVSAWSGALRHADGAWGTSQDRDAGRGIAQGGRPSALRISLRIAQDGPVSRIFMLHD